MIFAAAVTVATSDKPAIHVLPELAFAVPGGILLGIAIGATLAWMMRWMFGTVSATLLGFIATFGAWILAEHLHLSAILAVVAFGMTIAHVPASAHAAPRLGEHATPFGKPSCFLLNVLAFFLMGLQASEIISRLNPAELWEACGFAAIVFGIVVVSEIRVGDALYAHERIRRNEAWQEKGSETLRTQCSFRGVACAGS